MHKNNQIRKKIREIINLEEYDLLFKSSKDWNESKKELRSDLTTLLKHIEDDDYKEGVEQIEKVSQSLKKWKNKIEKIIGNE